MDNRKLVGKRALRSSIDYLGSQLRRIFDFDLNTFNQRHNHGQASFDRNWWNNETLSNDADEWTVDAERIESSIGDRRSRRREIY